jgi:hypothetical protein
MQIFLGQAPPFVWWFVAISLSILFVELGASRLVRSFAVLIEARGRVKVALAALQANTEKSTPSKRTASK